MSPTNVFGQTFSITFGEQVENHTGMQKIGNIAKCGFSVKKLKEFQSVCSDSEYTDLTKFLPKELSDDELEAGIFVWREGLKKLLKGSKFTIDDMYNEHNQLNPDKKALMRGRVVNKIARYNLCFADKSQKPNYEKGMGTIVAFDDLPVTSYIRHKLHELFGKKAKGLFAEGNYYYDPDKCYIGFHGDTERKIVICIRLGDEFPLHYQWYQNCKPVSEIITFDINGGDVYIMSSKAVGFDWKKRSIPTLRHAAGSLEHIQ